MRETAVMRFRRDLMDAKDAYASRLAERQALALEYVRRFQCCYWCGQRDPAHDLPTCAERKADYERLQAGCLERQLGPLRSRARRVRS